MNKIWLKLRSNGLVGKIRFLIPQKAVNLFIHLPLAVLACLFYRFPSRKMKVIGVTGTDGKTTTVNLIYEIIKASGEKTAEVSTLSARIGHEEIDTGFHVTSPNSWQLQKLLRKMVDQKVKFAVLEVTSHGLDQFRFWGVNFFLSVLTNVTHEHLDYHKTYERYLATKAKLLLKSKTAVINRDDESYDDISSKLKVKNLKLVTYGIKNKADFTPDNFNFKTLLPGEYNKYNCLAAIAATSELKIAKEKIRKAIGDFKGVCGRMEEINLGQDFKVFVDFAHTPNALKQALITLKEQSAKENNGSGKTIVVFGCAGLRDKTKRPLMGEIACRLADFTVLTAEDPRTEKVAAIIEEIASGCLAGAGKEGKTFYKISDRQEAINFAVCKLAGKQDYVLIAGKGHEKSMCFNQTECPWSDKEAAKKAINLLLKNKDFKRGEKQL